MSVDHAGNLEPVQGVVVAMNFDTPTTPLFTLSEHVPDSDCVIDFPYRFIPGLNGEPCVNFDCVKKANWIPSTPFKNVTEIDCLPYVNSRDDSAVLSQADKKAPTRDALSNYTGPESNQGATAATGMPPAHYQGGIDQSKVYNMTTKKITKSETTPHASAYELGVNLNQHSPQKRADVLKQTQSIMDPIERQAQIIGRIWPSLTDNAQTCAPSFAAIYQAIKQQQKPNYIGARIPVPSDLNHEAWEAALADYHDRTICQFLRFGWPLGYHKDLPPTSVEKNHPSAEYHMDHVQKICGERTFVWRLAWAIFGPSFHPMVPVFSHHDQT